MFGGRTREFTHVGGAKRRGLVHETPRERPRRGRRKRPDTTSRRTPASGSGSPPARAASAATATGLPGPAPTRISLLRPAGRGRPPIAHIGSFSESFREHRSAVSRSLQWPILAIPELHRRCAPQSCTPASDKTDYLQKIGNRLYRWAIRQILARTCFARARTCMPGREHLIHDTSPPTSHSAAVARSGGVGARSPADGRDSRSDTGSGEGLPTSGRRGRRTNRGQPGPRHQAETGQLMATRPR
jgi:hypothetical protein